MLLKAASLTSELREVESSSIVTPFSSEDSKFLVREYCLHREKRINANPSSQPTCEDFRTHLGISE